MADPQMASGEDGDLNATVGGVTPAPTPPRAELTQANCLEEELVLARARARLLGGDDGAPNATIGRYRVIRKLGSGGMGVVYEAHDDELDRRVALKVLKAELARSAEGRSRLVREAQAMARLSHPNVVHVYEIGHHGRRIFIAMEMIRGTTLRGWVDQPGRRWQSVLGVYLQAARGLCSAHDVGLVHRDFKPDNVLVDAAGRAHVLDFGLARYDNDISLESDEDVDTAENSEDITLTGTVMGTPAYMPPEQLAGGRPDHRADQFAFCVSLYEALYGCRPFNGSTAAKLAKAIATTEPTKPSDNPRSGPPGRIRAILRRGLAADPRDRFVSMQALIDAITPLSERRWGRRLAWAFGAAGAIAIASNFAPQTADEGAHSSVTADPMAEIVADSDLPPVLDSPLPHDPAGVTVHRLRNGLTVYVAPRSGEPTVEAVIAVRAGAREDPPGQAGLSRLVYISLGDSDRLGSMDPEAEKPLLQRRDAAIEALEWETDSARRSELFASAIEAANEARPLQIPGEEVLLGSELGFGTPSILDGPGSVFQVSVPRNRLEAWAELTAESLRRPVFRYFIGGAQYVMEEQQRRASDAAGLALERRLGELSGIVFDARAVAQTATKLPLAATRRFWETHYRPNNTAIVLVGDVSADTALPVLERTFGTWEPAPIPVTEPTVRVGERKVETVVDDGTAQVLIAWPLPRDPDALLAMLALDDVINHSMLAKTWLEEDGRARWLEPKLMHEHLEFAVEPKAGRSLADAERAAFDFLRAIANDEISPARWESVRGVLRLEALLGADAPWNLAYAIGASYTLRIPWAKYVDRIRGRAPSAPAVAQTAAALLETTPAIVHHRPGPPADPGLPTLDLPEPDGGETMPASFPSPYARQQLSAPVTALEPQFLVRGRDFQQSRRGAGQVVAVERDSPAYSARFVWPVGVADDPLVCDAWRALVSSAGPRTDPMSVHLEPICAAHETTIAIRGTVRDFDTAWPTVRAALEHDLPGEHAIATYVEITLERRAFLRAEEEWRTMAFAVTALRGTQGVDAWLPNDARLRGAQPAAFRRALDLVRKHDPDVLYAGPRSAEFVARLGPRPAAPDRKRSLTRPQPLERTRVFVMHDAHRARAEVRRVVAIPTPDAHTVLMGDLLRQAVVPEPELPNDNDMSLFAMPIAQTLGAEGIVQQLGIECRHRDVVRAIESLERAHAYVPNAEDWTRARSSFEAHARSGRRTGIDRAAAVLQWMALGRQTDPAADNWFAFPTVTDAELVAFHAETKRTPAVITVIADTRKLGMGALERFGEVVRLQVTDLIDTEMTDMRVFGWWSPEEG